MTVEELIEKLKQFEPNWAVDVCAIMPVSDLWRAGIDPGNVQEIINVTEPCLGRIMIVTKF